MNPLVRIAKQSLICNWLHTCLVGMAIILVSLLFGTVFGITSSIIQSHEISMQLATGSDFHAMIPAVNEVDLAIIQEHNSVELAYFVTEKENVFFKKDNALIPAPMIFSNEDASILAHMFSKMEEGYYPTEPQEILLEKSWLIQNKISLVIGNPIILWMDEEPHEFILSGYYTNNADIRANRVAYTVGWEEESYTAYIRYHNAINIEGKTEKLTHKLTQSGIPIINDAFILARSEQVSGSSIILFVIAVGTVFLCGFLLVNNVYEINLNRDISMFGLMKTIGITRRQLHQIVFLQINCIYLIAMPIGIFVSYQLGFKILMPMFMTLSGKDYGPFYQYSIIIFLMTMLFTYITLVYAGSRPTRYVANLPCLDAVLDRKKERGINQRGHNLLKGTLWGIAYKNVVREPRKVIFTILSVVLSAVILVLVGSIVQLFSINDNIQKSDFKIGRTIAYDNSIVVREIITEDEIFDIEKIPSLAKEVPIPKELLKNIVHHEGVQEVILLYVHQYEIFADEIMDRQEDQNDTNKIGRDKITVNVVSISEAMMTYLNQKLFVSGGLSKEFMTEEEIIINTKANDQVLYEYELGEGITIGNGKYRVAGVVNGYYNFLGSIGLNYLYGIDDFIVFMPERLFMENFGEVSKLHSLDVFIEEQAYESVKSLVSSFGDIGLTIRDKQVEWQQLLVREHTIKVVGYSLFAMILLIGIMNYSNMVICNIYARKREFALLEIIGMTQKQITRILLYENLLYFLLVAIFSPAISALFNLVIFTLGNVEYRLDLSPLLYLIGFIAIVCTFGVVLALGILYRASPMERMKSKL